MEVWDDDDGHFLGVGSERDLIDKVYGKFRYIVAGPDASNPRVHEKFVSTVAASCL